MKYYRYLAVFCGACLLSACEPQTTFQDDPLCPSCVKRACHGQEPAFETHFQSLSAPEQAQIIAQMEAQPGCVEKFAWVSARRDAAYTQFGAAFYGAEQPFYEIRAQRALDEVTENRALKKQAIGYLSAHVSAWKTTEFGKEAMHVLEPHLEDNDVFGLVAQAADTEVIAKLAAMEPTPDRDAALIYHWPHLPAEAQSRALKAWVSAEWSMQTSGSAQLPQYLVLDWTRRALPEGVPEFVSTLEVKSIKIKNEEAKRGGVYARDVFDTEPLRTPNTVHRRVNLTPWLNVTDTYRIAAQAELQIWSENVSDSCFNADSGCEQTPILSVPVTLDRNYKVFLGLETGAPHRHKVDADNAKTTKALGLELCNTDSCLPLWADGSRTKDRKKAVSVFQGKDFYLKVNPGNAQQPIAGRLMARTGVGKAWREVATFFSYAPMVYAIPTRADISLGSLCPEIGKCTLEFQLRPSLRMARRDPRIKRYWGATLELGSVQLDVLNQTPI